MSKLFFISEKKNRIRNNVGNDFQKEKHLRYSFKLARVFPSSFQIIALAFISVIRRGEQKFDYKL